MYQKIKHRFRKGRRYHPYRGKIQLHAVPKLFQFQQRALQWSQRIRNNQDLRKNGSRGLIFNMQYGFGKTVVSLAHARRYAWNTLFLCPTNVVSHIIDEIKHHFHSEQVSFCEAKAWEPSQFRRHHITIMSYYTLSRISSTSISAWNYHIFNTCIIDELEDIVTKKETRAKLNLIPSRFYIGLTGANTISNTIMEIVNTNSRRALFVMHQARNYNLETHTLQLSQEQRTSYNKQKTGMNECDPGLKAHRKLMYVRSQVSLFKINHVLRLLSDNIGMKILVVSEFTQSLSAIAAQLVHYNQCYCAITAGTRGQDKRACLIRDFQHNTKLNVMLADLEIITYGIDLGFVDIMIVVDLPMSVDSYRQLQGRLTRLGQNAKNLKVQRVIELVVQQTCDDVLYKDIHNTKRYLI